MSTSDYATMGQPYTAEEIEKMEGADVNRLLQAEVVMNETVARAAHSRFSWTLWA